LKLLYVYDQIAKYKKQIQSILEISLL